MSGKFAHLNLVSAGKPPAHALAQVDRAAARAMQMAEMDRELHFDVDADGRVVVQLRALDGTVVRAVDPCEALDIMSGLTPID